MDEAGINGDSPPHVQREGESRDPFKDEEHGLGPVSVERIEKVYKKLDIRIIPAFWTLYFLCSAIRSNVALSQTMNIAQKHDLGSELNITPKQISTGLALFYVCYVIFDLPSNLVMTRLSPRVWMSRIVVAVGIVGSCMAAMKAAWSFYLLRLLLGIVIAGMWPGMAYYLTLFYPPSRIGKRIGQYFTAAQVSAAVVGLVSAGFQKMDDLQGLVGFQWMFLLYGLVTTCVGFALLWWLPDRPLPPGETADRNGWNQWIPRSRPALTGEDALIHYEDLTRVYRRSRWTLTDLGHVIIDWRVWPLLVMYFGVVGVGIGVQNYATVIIRAINPKLTGIELSLLSAPIWIMDLIAILLVTPFSDRFHHHRALFFSVPVCIQIAGLLMTTYAGKPWPRYGGLLLVGFGLGPTVPITMTWTTEIFQRRHGEVGVAVASALVSGLGNLGSILTTYALFQGWPTDARKGRKQYRKSTLVMVGILCLSILSAVMMTVLLRYFGSGPNAKQVSSASSTSEAFQACKSFNSPSGASRFVVIRLLRSVGANAELLGGQFFMTLLIMALIGNVIADAFAGNPSIINYVIFVSVFAMLSLFYLIGASIIESLAIPIAMVILDALNTLLFLIGGIALAAYLGVHSCGNRSYVEHNKITNGSHNPTKRCHEEQAACAFLWFGAAAWAASLIMTALSSRGGAGGLRRGEPFVFIFYISPLPALASEQWIVG
ncbi:MAG: hypothetical protein Q9219_003131 [cf. Caloplaca sp. 3 TL-2023]